MPKTNYKPIDFLIITALRDELDAILLQMEDHRQDQIADGLACYFSSTQGADKSNEPSIAVCLLPEMGNVEAGIHTTRAIEILAPRCVLMVGIAGGIKGKANLGDILVANQIFYYESAKMNGAFPPEVRPLTINGDPLLLESARHFTDISWRNQIGVAPPIDNLKKVHSQAIKFGPFAVGDKVIANQEAVNALKHLHPKIIGIEMESYGVGRAASTSGPRPRFLAIRGVSDLADESKNDSWRKFAAASAAAYALGLIRSGLINLEKAEMAHSRSQITESGGSLLVVGHISMKKISKRAYHDALFAHYPGYEISELWLDQTDLYEEGVLIDPLEAAKRQALLMGSIDNYLGLCPNAQLAYFGLAHIPLLFYMGYQLSNKRHLKFFELNRYSGNWEILTEKTQGRLSKLEVAKTMGKLARSSASGDLVLRISISNTILVPETQEVVPNPLLETNLYLDPPKRDVVTSLEQLFCYGRQFRELLDMFHEYYPNRRRTHIFYAGPVALAVYLGQLIIPSIDRDIIIYNYMSNGFPRYSWAFEITKNIGDPDFYLKTSTPLMEAV